MVHNGGKKYKCQDLQINDQLVLRAGGCPVELSVWKSLVTPTIHVVAGLCSYPFKWKRHCKN